MFDLSLVLLFEKCESEINYKSTELLKGIFYLFVFFACYILAMRMADCSLPPVALFLTLPGEPPIPWPRWPQFFESYLSKCGYPQVGVMDVTKGWGCAEK